MSHVLHIVPDSVSNKLKPFVGSTKDVRGRTEYFCERGIEYREHLCVGRSDAEALAHLTSADLSDCAAVFFEYETYIESLRYLRQTHPRVRRLVRAHNANLPHQVDHFHGRTRMEDGPGAAESIHNSIARFEQDCACAALADAVLAICAWEAEHYWAPLAGPGRVVNVPYFLPRRFVPQLRAPKHRKLCVCFMGAAGLMTPLLYDAGRNAVDLVAALGDELPDWQFVITGHRRATDVLGPLGRIYPTDLMRSPFPLLSAARVVTLLSDLGMGFKTKILDAIMAGCWVIVTPDLLRRLPEAVRPWCKAVNVESPDELRRAILGSLHSPPESRPNEALRDIAFRGLDRVLSEGA